MLAISKKPKGVDVSFLLPEDGSRSILLKVVFSSYLEFLTMDKVHEPGDS
jgi:hypothetical protein